MLEALVSTNTEQLPKPSGDISVSDGLTLPETFLLSKRHRKTHGYIIKWHV